ncbi:MAG: hypothetical protein ACYCYA_08475 [Actinomycetes bacterium]
MWSAYHARLFVGTPPPDLDQHRAAIRAALARPGHWQAFLATTRVSHAPVEARLNQVSARCWSAWATVTRTSRTRRSRLTWWSPGCTVALCFGTCRPVDRAADA